MQPRSLEQRVASLEDQARAIHELSGSVQRLELHNVQHREELTAAISAIKVEYRRADEETRQLARVLYEDVLSRIAVIGEGP